MPDGEKEQDGGEDLESAIEGAAELGPDLNGQNPGEGEVGEENQVDQAAGGEGEDGAAGGESSPAADDPAAKMAAMEARIAELTEFRENAEKRFAESQEKKGQEEPQKPRDEARWREIEKNFGFSTQKDKETGEETTSFDRRQFLQTLEGFVGNVARQIREDIESRFHTGMSRFTVDSAMSDLEKRPSNALPDIRQYSQAIKAYLAQWHRPEDHANPKVIEAAYYWAKGRGLKDAIKKVVNAQNKNLKVIHPKGGGQGRPGAPAPRKVGNDDAGRFLEKAGW
jgi:hypothetical protein